MVAALQANKVAVTYALFPDEGHGFGRPANALCFSIIQEAFLARYLGGALRFRKLMKLPAPRCSAWRERNG